MDLLRAASEVAEELALRERAPEDLGRLVVLSAEVRRAFSEPASAYDRLVALPALLSLTRRTAGRFDSAPLALGVPQDATLRKWIDSAVRELGLRPARHGDLGWGVWGALISANNFATEGWGTPTAASVALLTRYQSSAPELNAAVRDALDGTPLTPAPAPASRGIGSAELTTLIDTLRAEHEARRGSRATTLQRVDAAARCAAVFSDPRARLGDRMLAMPDLQTSSGLEIVLALRPGGLEQLEMPMPTPGLRRGWIEALQADLDRSGDRLMLSTAALPLAARYATPPVFLPQLVQLEGYSRAGDAQREAATQRQPPAPPHRVVR